MNNNTEMKIGDEWTFGCNRCLVCDGIHRHKTVITKYEDGLEEVNFHYIHPHCIKSVKRIAKLKEKLLDAEFAHFCLRFNINE
jgi:hypothetical protein